MRARWHRGREHDPEQQGFVFAEVSPSADPLAVSDQNLALAHRRRLAADLDLDQAGRHRNDPAACLDVPGGLRLARRELDEIHPHFGVDAAEQRCRVLCSVLRLLDSTADAVQRGILASQQLIHRDAPARC